MDIDTALAKTLPELQAAERKLRAYASKEGIVYEIAAFGGFRTEADTARILKYRDDDYAVYVSNMAQQGKTPLPKEQWRRIAPYGRSYHDFGAAFDVQIKSAPTGVSFTTALTKLGALAPLCGLRWGGSFGDAPHFELAQSLTDVQTKWDAYQQARGLPAVSVTPTGVSAIIASVLPAKTPAAAATITAGALVAAGLLFWLVYKRAAANR